MFPDLTSKQQAYISELVSSVKPVLQALMSNWQTVMGYETMNSMGAVKENENI